MILVNQESVVICSGELSIVNNVVYKDGELYIGKATGLTIVDIPNIPIIYEDGIYKYIDGDFIIYDNEAYSVLLRSSTVIPIEIRMAQCRAQLIIDGKDDDVEALLASIADPIQQKLYRAYFEYEPIVKRDNVMINEMAPLLGIDLDQFFIDASKL